MQHIKLLRDTGKYLTTSDGIKVKIFKLLKIPNEKILSIWAKHIRNQYCPDIEINALIKGTGLTNKEFLKKYIFPDEKVPPGPSIRAGDFGELLITDYVEFILNFYVPRIRFKYKGRNRSIEDTDIIGFKIINKSIKNNKDTLLTFEVKAAFQNRNLKVFQEAINGSKKDWNWRKAISLYSIKRKLIIENKPIEANIVERFQDKTGNPYIEISGAAAIISNHVFSKEIITKVNAIGHPNSRLYCILIKGNQLMELTNLLIQRACNDA